MIDVHVRRKRVYGWIRASSWDVGIHPSRYNELKMFNFKGVRLLLMVSSIGTCTCVQYLPTCMYECIRVTIVSSCLQMTSSWRDVLEGRRGSVFNRRCPSISDLPLYSIESHCRGRRVETAQERDGNVSTL